MRTLVIVLAILSVAATAGAGQSPRFSVVIVATSTTTWTQDGCVGHLTDGTCWIHKVASGTDTMTIRNAHPIFLTLDQLRRPDEIYLNNSVVLSATISRHGRGTSTDPRDGYQRTLDTSDCGTVVVSVPSGGIQLGWQARSQTFLLSVDRLGSVGLEACPSPGRTGILEIRNLTRQAAQPSGTARRTIVISGSARIDRSAAVLGTAGSSAVSWRVTLTPA